MKTIFITGASSGLGKATAKLFANHGWHVIATMSVPEHETELNKIDNITLMRLDVNNPDQIESVVMESLKFGNVDVVFNNAGYVLAGPFEATSDDQLLKQIGTSLLGTMRLTRAFIPHFRKRGLGIFISTTSHGALIQEPFMSVYSATKSALESWSASISYELNKFGIQIKTIVPGFMKTELIKKSLQLIQQSDYDSLVIRFFRLLQTQIQGQILKPSQR